MRIRATAAMAGVLLCAASLGSAQTASVGVHSTSAEDSTPAQDLVDDKLLAQAAHEVEAMNPQQLEAFIDYLATCTPRATVLDLSIGLRELPESKNSFLCDVATRKFEIKNSGAAALGRLTRTLDLHLQIALLNKLDSEILQSFQRRIDIFRELKRSASARYTELSKTK